MSGKTDHRKRRLIAATLMLIVALAGCTPSTRMEPGATWVNSDEQRIILTTAGFKATRPIRVKYTDAWQTQEYALFRADGRQCEMIYAEADRAFTVALDYQMPIKKMVTTWNLNSRQNLIWGQLGRIDRRFGTWFYRPYKISDLQRPCVGFMVEWDQIYEDPQGRPGKVLFGYFCRTEGETLEDQDVRTLIRGFGVRTQVESSGDQKTNPRHHAGSEKPSAIAAAKGYGPSADSGNPSFPFMFARYYSVSGGGKLP